MYKHGIEVTEKQTANVRPLSTSYGVQVIDSGTAPIHLTAHPEQAVNKPILLNSWEEAKEKLPDTRNDGICILCVRVCTHPGNCSRYIQLSLLMCWIRSVTVRIRNPKISRF